MLNERWGEEVEEVGDALRKLLRAESNPERVRAAEATEDGRDSALEAQLAAFGLNDLKAGTELFARIAYELGRGLATTSYVETIPVLAVLHLSDISCGFNGPVPATLAQVAVRRSDGVYVEPLNGEARRSAAGDFLVEHRSACVGERMGDVSAADRIERYAALADAARMVGAGQALLEYGLGYARERQQFGKPIGSYQGVAHRLSNAATLLDSAELLLRKAAFTALPEVGGDGAPSDPFAIMARVKAVDAARFVSTTVHQVFGGNGFAMEYDVQLYSRRLRSWAMRGRRPRSELAELGRAMLDPARRNSMRLIWHYDTGMPLPRWAKEADSRALRKRG